MNNEPVAFVSKDDLKDMTTHLCDLHLKPQKHDIPLYTHYTHPADLTDEEILHTFNPKFMCDLEDSDVIDFGRAILKKASEK
jgi:hypothetical protein